MLPAKGEPLFMELEQDGGVPVSTGSARREACRKP